MRAAAAPISKACLKARNAVAGAEEVSGGKSNDYSHSNLQNCGYALRNWVNFLVYRQLYFRVLAADG